MNYRQAENIVKIEGILAETDLKYGSFMKNGEPVEYIGGSIKVLVEQEINGQASSLEIPVYMFSSKYTKAGKVNPSYESIEKVMKEYVSIAAAGSANLADKIRITSGNIRMNEFAGQGGKIVSTPRVHASFVSRVVGEFAPQATFSLEFMVSSISRATDTDGVEIDPTQLNIQVIVPQYTSPNATAMNVDLVPLKAYSAGVVNAIETYWEAGRCYRANGRLNFTSRTEEVVEEVDFGEAQKRSRTTSVSEFIVTGGSQSPIDEDFAWDLSDIKAGMAARNERLEEIKSGKKTMQKQTPAPASLGTKGKQDLGF